MNTVVVAVAGCCLVVTAGNDKMNYYRKQMY